MTSRTTFQFAKTCYKRAGWCVCFFKKIASQWQFQFQRLKVPAMGKCPLLCLVNACISLFLMWSPLSAAWAGIISSFSVSKLLVQINYHLHFSYCGLYKSKKNYRHVKEAEQIRLLKCSKLSMHVQTKQNIHTHTARRDGTPEGKSELIPMKVWSLGTTHAKDSYSLKNPSSTYPEQRTEYT